RTGGRWTGCHASTVTYGPYTTGPRHGIASTAAEPASTATTKPARTAREAASAEPAPSERPRRDHTSAKTSVTSGAIPHHGRDSTHHANRSHPGRTHSPAPRPAIRPLGRPDPPDRRMPSTDPPPRHGRALRPRHRPTPPPLQHPPGTRRRATRALQDPPRLPLPGLRRGLPGRHLPPGPRRPGRRQGRA